MMKNELFRQCLAAVPEEQKAEFELSFGIADKILWKIRENFAITINSIIFAS